MKREDERILEYLEENGLASPTLISREVFESVSSGHVNERLAVMRDAQMVDCSGLNSFELCEAGQRYLDGDLDAEHLPTPSVDRVLKND